MKFKEFAEYLSKLESISSRNELTIIIAELLSKLSVDEVDYALYMIQGRLAPKYVDLEFNMSGKMVVAALNAIYDENEIKKLVKESGDIGTVAEHIVEKISNGHFKQENSLFNGEKEINYEDKNFEIVEVYNALKAIAEASGKGSSEMKINGYSTLITMLDPLSARYITRVIVGALRLGLSDKTMLDSFSWFLMKDKSLRILMDGAFGARADIGALAKIIIASADPVKELEQIAITPGTPVASKLVEREKDSHKVWERMPNCFAQPKLDGLRGQIHKWQEEGEFKVEIYSRNMENMTDQFPDLVQAAIDLPVKSFILDSEIIGFNRATGEYLSYQETMQRRRKYEISEKALEIPVKSMCFDILAYEGTDVSKKPIEERIDLLRTIMSENKSDHLAMLETIQMQTEEELNDYFERLVGDGLEGIITKETNSTYEPGTRNFSWIKLKANTKSELVDTIDVAIIGYYNGRGQRAKFGIGAFLTALYNPETDLYYSFGKVGSGITDDMFVQINKDISGLELVSKPDNVIVEKPLYPDVWLTPKIIIEIVADEITRSPSHTAAIGIPAKVKKDDSTRGLSVRFPRLKVWNRDKDLPNTVQEIVRMYELRKGE